MPLWHTFVCIYLLSIPFSYPLFAPYLPPVSIGTSLEPDWNFTVTIIFLNCDSFSIIFCN